ncbi:Mothers against decapentaplegic like [Schistosoma japonicum]|nr:Mothers against decapentaplegic like [Schistosoma japonicum]
MLVLPNPYQLDLKARQCVMSLNTQLGCASPDIVTVIVHSLMCHRQSGESEEFAKRAIESLVKKLKERQEDLESLVTAITTNGNQPSKCVTIQRTLDGRMQIAGRKCLPHVIYSRIWRWPDLHRNELRHSKDCSFGFELKQDCVCINPYHYERVVSPVDLATLSLSPVDKDVSGFKDTQIADVEVSLPGGLTDGGDNISSSLMLSSRPRLIVRDLIEDQIPRTGCLKDQKYDFIQTSIPSNSLIDSASLLISNIPTSRVNPTPHLDRGQNTMAWSGIANPNHPYGFVQSATKFLKDNSIGSGNTFGYSDVTSVSLLTNRTMDVLTCTTSPSMTFTPTQCNSFSTSSFVSSAYSSSTTLVCLSGNTNGAVNNSSNKRAGGSSGNSGGCGAGGSGFGTNAPCGGVGGTAGGGGGWGNRRGPPAPPFTPSGSILQPLPVLTTQRPPEYWCNIAYFELDQQVGELFKVPSQYSRVTVDGYTDPSSPNRFCLGQLSNVHRSEQSEKSRLYIGKGVELDNVGEGDVWIRCLSEFSVFVQSYYLDREAGRAPGDAVHKIYPGAYIKVFDIRQCHEEMKSLAQSSHAAAVRQAAAVVGSPTTNDLLSQLPGALPLGPSQSASGSLPGTLSTGASIMATAGVGVDDLRRLCMLRLSFVKGWGPDYPRRSIKETPCWIEIQLHRPLQLLDEVLQAMPLNDLKPTRHFFSYFPQSSGCNSVRPAAAKRARKLPIL